MSAITLGQQGVEAAKAGNWDEALTKLTKALSSSATKPPPWLLARSKALVASGDFTGALADASLAYNTASDRNDRQRMTEAQYRRAVAYYRLGRYADGDCCCVWAMSVEEGSRIAEGGAGQTDRVDGDGDYDVTMDEVVRLVDEQLVKPPKLGGGGDSEGGGSSAAVMNVLGMGLGGGASSKTSEGGDGGQTRKNSHLWIQAATFRRQCIAAMDKLEKGAPGRKVTAKKTPPREEFSARVTSSSEEKKGKGKEVEKSGGSTPLAATAAAAAGTPSKPKEVRIDSYQTDAKQTITVFAKGVDKDRFAMTWNSDRELVMRPVPGAPDDAVTLRLAGDAARDESTVRVALTKIELVVKKASPGKWAKPELAAMASGGTAAAAAQSTSTESVEREKEEAEKKPALATETTSKPSANPPAASSASSTTAPEEMKPPAYPTSSKTGPKNWDSIVSAQEGANDDEDDGRDANDWFRHLYKGASPDAQRAMMKSFTESNGTALSTNWEDVKDRTIETKPPEGVEAKKWD